MLAVKPEHFLDQMKFLKEHFPVLKYDADWSGVREPSVVVTFDDGYADNYLEALPILQETGVAATFFITPELIDSNQEFWWDELERVILGKWSYPDHFELKDKIYHRIWLTATESERKTLYNELHPLMRSLAPERRKVWLKQLRQWVKTDEAGRASHRLLKNQELQALAKSSFVTIGAHGMTHTSLGGQPMDSQENEMKESREQLEAIINRPVISFSYPFGTKSDYTTDTMNLCKRLGFTKAAANYPGQARRWTNRFEIPRQIVRDWPIDIFEKKISEFWTR
ncbi:MAG: polysaccharide deacetylase family protein [Nitrospinae bacterium]|nr:polysaccharide deacetylase family protein [Nitrospinota bacterium]